MELFQKKQTGQRCLRILYSDEQRNKVFRARTPDNSQDLLQCVRFFLLLVSLQCTQSTLLVFHSSHIHSGDLLDSSLLCKIQLAKGQQDERRILLASSGSGWNTEHWNSSRGPFSNIRRRSRGSCYKCGGGQSRSSLHTQAHSSWCSRATSVRDFCRPLPPLRYFSSSTCQEGRRLEYFSESLQKQKH